MARPHLLSWKRTAHQTPFTPGIHHPYGLHSQAGLFKDIQKISWQNMCADWSHFLKLIDRKCLCGLSKYTARICAHTRLECAQHTRKAGSIGHGLQAKSGRTASPPPQAHFLPAPTPRSEICLIKGSVCRVL